MTPSGTVEIPRSVADADSIYLDAIRPAAVCDACGLSRQSGPCACSFTGGGVAAHYQRQRRTEAARS